MKSAKVRKKSKKKIIKEKPVGQLL
jgi:hypothetical protein